MSYVLVFASPCIFLMEIPCIFTSTKFSETLLPFFSCCDLVIWSLPWENTSGTNLTTQSRRGRGGKERNEWQPFCFHVHSAQAGPESCIANYSFAYTWLKHRTQELVFLLLSGVHCIVKCWIECRLKTVFSFSSYVKFCHVIVEYKCCLHSQVDSVSWLVYGVSFSCLSDT